MFRVGRGTSYVEKMLQYSVILLQIVMVSPGTHLVKNCESLSITSKSQFKTTRSPKLKMLGALCNQTVNLETDAKTLYYSLLKLKYSPSIYLNNSHEQDIPKKNLQIDGPFSVSYRTHLMNYLVSLGIFMHQGGKMQR